MVIVFKQHEAYHISDWGQGRKFCYALFLDRNWVWSKYRVKYIHTLSTNVAYTSS